MRLLETEAGSTLSGLLGPDDVAYVDADWLRARGDVEPLVMRANTDADSLAATALLRVARDAVAAVATIEGAVETTGSGFVALAVEELLAARSSQARADVPSAIVETTGDATAILSAASRLANLGTLVLAATPPGGTLSLDLYPDVHVRGLVIVGVPPPVLDADAAPVACVPPPVPACIGSPLRLGARWYRITA